MKYSTWLWPTVLLLSALAIWVVYMFLPGSVLRPYIALWFFVLCPGMALIRLLRLRGIVAEYTLAVATSLTLEALIASIQIYTHSWSPTLTLNILIGICVVGALLQLYVLRSTSHPGEQSVITS